MMRERAIIIICWLQDFIYKTSALPPFTHVQKKAKAYICVCFMWITINDEYQKIHTYIYKIVLYTSSSFSSMFGIPCDMGKILPLSGQIS